VKHAIVLKAQNQTPMSILLKMITMLDQSQYVLDSQRKKTEKGISVQTSVQKSYMSHSVHSTCCVRVCVIHSHTCGTLHDIIT